MRSIDAKAKLWTTSWTWTQLEADDVTRQAMDLPALVGGRALLLRLVRALFHERASKQRGAVEMGIMQAR